MKPVDLSYIVRKPHLEVVEQLKIQNQPAVQIDKSHQSFLFFCDLGFMVL